jgi:hypothetical protein
MHEPDPTRREERDGGGEGTAELAGDGAAEGLPRISPTASKMSLFKKVCDRIALHEAGGRAYAAGFFVGVRFAFPFYRQSVL